MAHEALHLVPVRFPEVWRAACAEVERGSVEKADQDRNVFAIAYKPI